MSLFLTSKSKDANDKQIFDTKQNSLSNLQIICCLVNTAIGSGSLKLAYAFRSGVILSLIINLFFSLLSYYTTILFLKTGAFHQKSTFEEIWTRLFGKKSSWICTIFSLIVTLCVLISFMDSIATILSDIINAFTTNQRVLNNNVTLCLIIIAVFMIPICLVSNLKYVVILSLIAIFCMLFIIIVAIVEFVIEIQHNGFDSYHEIAYFRFDSHIFTCVSALSTSYLLFPLGFPTLKHLKYSSYNKWKRNFFWINAFCFIYYSLMGVFGYLTFFDHNDGDLIIVYYDVSRGVKVLYNCVVLLLIIFSSPMFLNPARYILLNSFFETKHIPHSIWCLTGITIVFLAATVSFLENYIYDIIISIYDVVTFVIIFIVPSFLYIATFKLSDRLNFAGATFIFLIGVVLVSVQIYFDVK